MSNPFTIYVGYDPREDMSYRVLEKSIRLHSSEKVNVIPILQSDLRRLGMYSRGVKEVHNSDGTIQRYDKIDGRPFSTEFSFTRFLTPHLNLYTGWALFMDCDMYFRSDPIEIFDTYNDSYVPLYCVKHNYKPLETWKMDNQMQVNYNMKNWSSVMLFNCGHEAHKNLTMDDVSTKTGRWLHNFGWLDPSDIGEMNEEWNWLDNWSPETVKAKNVHFTNGGPFFPNWTGRPIDHVYAREWKELA